MKANRKSKFSDSIFSDLVVIQKLNSAIEMIAFLTLRLLGGFASWREKKIPSAKPGFRAKSQSTVKIRKEFPFSS